MDMDRGTLAMIDRKLLAGLGHDETYRTLRVPASGAKWSTWRRYCGASGISMGRAVTMLIDRELMSVFGDITGDESPLFAQRATETASPGPVLGSAGGLGLVLGEVIDLGPTRLMPVPAALTRA